MDYDELLTSLYDELVDLRKNVSVEKVHLQDVAMHGSMGDKQVALTFCMQRNDRLDSLGTVMKDVIDHLQCHTVTQPKDE